MIVLTAVIGLFLAVLPAGDPGADLGQHVELRGPGFPFLLIYLNSKLPKTARPKAWTYVVLLLNFLFFGFFFFLNFVFDQLTGETLIQF